jgi:hypothetical protein
MTATACSSRNRLAPFLVGLLIVTACDKPPASGENASAPAASAQTADEQLVDIANYRLTMDKIDKYVAAQRNIMLKAKSLSPAERAAMEARNEGKNNANATLDDMTRNIESEPMMRDAVRDAGLSPREFTMVTISLMQTAMASGVAKMRPNDNQDSLIRAMKASPENVKFFLENEAEITRRQTALAEEMKKLGVDGDS